MTPRSEPRAERRAGVGVPLFALRCEGDHGIGDFACLEAFVEWAAREGQRIIALLPLGELGTGEASPYNALSSFALDPIFLSLQRIDEGRADQAAASADAVDYAKVRERKRPALETAFALFQRLPSSAPRRRRYASFARGSAEWLDDYTLFRALLEEQGDCSWRDWPPALRDRDRRELAAARSRLRERIAFFAFRQFLADEAWREVRRFAARHDVWLMGDLPFAPSENSADVWANQSLFDLSRSVGAPPDDFSETGQRWGLPMMRWQAMRDEGWRWFRARARRMGELYDLFRVDHVVGLFRTFTFIGETPCGFDPPEEPAQIEQGREILGLLLREAAPARLVAEDLGTIPPFVIDTLADMNIPGYKVLRWQREGDVFLDPATYPECSIATTGTHDTDTLTCWWQSLTPAERGALCVLAGRPADLATGPLTRDLRMALLALLYRCPSRYAILPIQDLFGWESRINTPGTTAAENWTYRVPLAIERFDDDPEITADVAQLRALIDASARLRRIS
jgi:4-alpha-glucanotransferase